jgi:hypothetical protein
MEGPLQQLANSNTRALNRKKEKKTSILFLLEQ